MKHETRSTPSAPVLVIGGTGATGRLVVAQLAAAGDHVRVLSRNATKARQILPREVDVVQGDLKVVQDVARAAQGVRAVLMTHGSDDGKGSAQEIDYGGVLNVVSSLDRSPVKLVLMSAIYVTRPEHPNNAHNPIFEWKRRAEELVRSSGNPYAIARASWLVRESTGTPTEIRLEQGDKGDGSVTHWEMATVLVQALRSAQAVGKTFEVYSNAAPSEVERTSSFADLRSDRVIEAA